MIKVSDFIAQRLTDYGVQQVFMITGGGAMHLNDSVARYLPYFCSHHEQASAIGAEGYARATGKPAVVLVTTGPGGTNTLTGLLGQWTDSVPVIYLSGQVKFETTIRSCPDVALRQLGDQEVDIVSIVNPITKFAACVTNPTDIKRMLDKAWRLASSGRPGPVWLDIPMNVQGALIDENALPELEEAPESVFNKDAVKNSVSEVLALLKSAKRPLIVAGHGIRLSGARELLLQFISRTRMPVVTTFNGFDLVPSAHPSFVGRIGSIGDRAGNYALQNADLLLILGSRNNVRQISYNWKVFGRAADKVVVDIDAAELAKPTIVPDIPIHSDAAFFLTNLNGSLGDLQLPEWSKWSSWCMERKIRYPVVLPEYEYAGGLIEPYYFTKVLTEELAEDAVVVTANGTASVVYFQAGIVKERQRVIWNSGCASMGYDLPAAIGACLGSERRRVVCIAGDGSIQMNIQELATVAYHRLPLSIFVLNNDGYVSIRQTQKNFFGKLAGCDPSTGVGFPDMQKIGEAYGIHTKKIGSHDGLRKKVREILDYPGPVLCEVMLNPDHVFSPKLSSERKPDGRIVSKPLEDMFPFLDREEFRGNMQVAEWEEK